jgi:hypothetical protein
MASGPGQNPRNSCCDILVLDDTRPLDSVIIDVVVSAVSWRLRGVVTAGAFTLKPSLCLRAPRKAFTARNACSLQRPRPNNGKGGSGGALIPE